MRMGRTPSSNENVIRKGIPASPPTQPGRLEPIDRQPRRIERQQTKPPHRDPRFQLAAVELPPRLPESTYLPRAPPSQDQRRVPPSRDDDMSSDSPSTQASSSRNYNQETRDKRRQRRLQPRKYSADDQPCWNSLMPLLFYLVASEL